MRKKIRCVTLLASMAILQFVNTGMRESQAGIIFSENFSGAVPGAENNLNGTRFFVSTDNVDIVGDINGSYFNYNGETNNNGLDLAGVKPGAIQSIDTFTLFAGHTYSLTFRSVASGGLDSDPFFDNSVKVGSFQFTFTDSQLPFDPLLPYAVTSRNYTFTPTTTETGASIRFSALDTHGFNGQNGSLIDDIVLTESFSAVPEPSTGVMFLIGCAGVAWRWRQKRQAIAQ